MVMAARFVCFVGILLCAAISLGQPLSTTLTSIELRTVQAKAIFCATVEKYEKGELTLNVGEVLKGKVGKTLVVKTSAQFPKRLVQWAEARTEFLWFAGIDDFSNLQAKHPELGLMNTIRLGDAVPEDSIFKPDEPVVAMDLKIIQGREEILGKVRRWSKHPSKVESSKIPLPTRDAVITSLLVLACRDKDCCQLNASGPQASTLHLDIRVASVTEKSVIVRITTTSDWKPIALCTYPGYWKCEVAADGVSGLVKTPDNLDYGGFYPSHWSVVWPGTTIEMNVPISLPKDVLTKVNKIVVRYKVPASIPTPKWVLEVEPGLMRSLTQTFISGWQAQKRDLEERRTLGQTIRCSTSSSVPPWPDKPRHHCTTGGNPTKWF